MHDLDEMFFVVVVECFRMEWVVFYDRFAVVAKPNCIYFTKLPQFSLHLPLNLLASIQLSLWVLQPLQIMNEGFDGDIDPNLLNWHQGIEPGLLCNPDVSLNLIY